MPKRKKGKQQQNKTIIWCEICTKEAYSCGDCQKGYYPEGVTIPPGCKRRYRKGTKPN